MKHNQAVLHKDDYSKLNGGGVVTAKNDSEYVKLDEVTLPDGCTKMKFFAKKQLQNDAVGNDAERDGRTFDDIMDEVYDLASDALVRKLSKS
jgi:hypothetical protein